MKRQRLRTILTDHASDRLTTEQAAQALAVLHREWGCLTLQEGPTSSPAERQLLKRFRDLVDGQ